MAECPFNPDRDVVATVFGLLGSVDKAKFEALSSVQLMEARECARGDLWASCTSHLEYQSVWIAPLRLVEDDKIEIVAKVLVGSEDKEHLILSALSLYLDDAPNAFAGLISVLREGFAVTSVWLERAARLNGRPVEGRPPKKDDDAAAEAAPPPPPPPAEERPRDAGPAPAPPPPPPAPTHMLSPNRSHYERDYVNNSHSYSSAHDWAYYERNLANKPDGGFGVDDLLLGRMPEISGGLREKHVRRQRSPTDAEYSYFRDAVTTRAHHQHGQRNSRSHYHDRDADRYGDEPRGWDDGRGRRGETWRRSPTRRDNRYDYVDVEEPRADANQRYGEAHRRRDDRYERPDDHRYSQRSTGAAERRRASDEYEEVPRGRGAMRAPADRHGAGDAGDSRSYRRRTSSTGGSRFGDDRGPVRSSSRGTSRADARSTDDRRGSSRAGGGGRVYSTRASRSGM